jgi:hypothetical protein
MQLQVRYRHFASVVVLTTEAVLYQERVYVFIECVKPKNGPREQKHMAK